MVRARRRASRACIGLLVAVLGLLASQARAAKPRAAEGPGLYASWHQPYGTPGASDQTVSTCEDTSWADTLYLTFEVPRPTPGLAGVNTSIFFSPQPGDSLGSFWHWKTGWENGGNMWIDFHPFFKLPGNMPWGDMGYFELGYDHRSGRGRLDIEFVVSPEKAIGLEPGRRYTFARVRLLHRRADLPGCRQPICVEWGGARLRYTTGREFDLPLTGSRFVGYNDAGGNACTAARAKTRAKPWQPKAK